MPIEYKAEIPDADSFFILYRTTGWDKDEKKQKEQLYEAIKNSWYMISVYSEDKLIGCGRMLRTAIKIKNMLNELPLMKIGIGNGSIRGRSVVCGSN